MRSCRDKLVQRAWQLADHIMSQPRTTRRMTTQIVRRPWRRQITDSLDGGFAIQMFAHLAKKKACTAGSISVRSSTMFGRARKTTSIDVRALHDDGRVSNGR